MMFVSLHFKGEPKVRMPVLSLAEAASEFCVERARNFSGASDMLGTCGNVYEDKKLVARVRYNGRVEQL